MDKIIISQKKYRCVDQHFTPNLKLDIFGLCSRSQRVVGL